MNTVSCIFVKICIIVVHSSLSAILLRTQRRKLPKRRPIGLLHLYQVLVGASVAPCIIDLYLIF